MDNFVVSLLVGLAAVGILYYSMNRLTKRQKDTHPDTEETDTQ